MDALKPVTSFREAVELFRRHPNMKMKFQAEREALEKKGFENIFSSSRAGSRYKVWKRGDDDAYAYVTGDQLIELVELKPAQIEKALHAIRAASDNPHAARPETMSVTTIIEEKEEIMKKTTTTNAAATTNATTANATTKAATKQSRERVNKSGLRDEILARINAATIEKNPVIHSKFKNTTEKKIARDLFRAGEVQRVEHEGQLYYLPKGHKLPKGTVIGEVRLTGGKRDAAPAETPAPKTDEPKEARKGGAKKSAGKKGGASKKVEGGETALARNAAAAEPADAKVTQTPAQAELRRRGKATSKGKTTKASAKGKAANKKRR
jgi:hypothetical protein